MGLYKLKTEAYQITSEIFKPLTAFQPLCSAVIAGLQQGKVFVDHPHTPQAAFLTVWETWCFLAGQPSLEFITSLNKAIFDRTVVSPDLDYLLFTIDEHVWQEHLHSVFAPRLPIPAARRHYATSQSSYDWRGHIPDGFEIQSLDIAMLSCPNLPVEIKETLERWGKATHPNFQDIGFAALANGEIAAWATIDGITNGEGDIGLVTQEPYRRRGLASATSAAVIEQAVVNQVKTIHWTCAENNLGSIRTAEKLNFELQGNYHAYFFEFDQLWNLIQLAGYKLNQDEFDSALELCNEANTLSTNPPAHLLIYTARSQALTGQNIQALDSLKRLVKTGWKDAAFLENDHRFSSLHEFPEWDQIIKKVKSN